MSIENRLPLIDDDFSLATVVSESEERRAWARRIAALPRDIGNLNYAEWALLNRLKAAGDDLVAGVAVQTATASTPESGTDSVTWVSDQNTIAYCSMPTTA